MKKFSTVFLFLFMGCSGNRVSTAGVEVPDRGNTVALSTPEKIEKNEMKDEGSEVTITLAAVGDIMAHLPQIKGAWNREKKSYDFMKSFADIGPSIWRADFAMGNLEAPLAGKSRGYSGFPSFN
ncbi:MAG: CapA family protein, partial [Deltaproteobacteria bacterium]|nr:CapA family protein [Deltaproteobacteria bacterium]